MMKRPIDFLIKVLSCAGVAQVSTIALPAVVLGSAVSLPASAAEVEAEAISRLEVELEALCSDTPQWPKIQEFLQLIRDRRDVDTRDPNGMTLLEHCMLEVKAGRAAVVESLLKAGASPNTPGINGMTPLHRAAYYDDYRSVLRLLAHGARPDVKNKQGVLPWQKSKRPQIGQFRRTGKPAECRTPYATDIWRKACSGDAAAQYTMSTLYNDGIGEHVGSIAAWVRDPATPDPDAAESRAWLEQAAAGGEPRALYELGIRLLWGRDGQQDEELARKYLQKAAAAGHRGAAEVLKDNP